MPQIAQYNPDSRERAIFEHEAERGGAAGAAGVAHAPTAMREMSPAHEIRQRALVGRGHSALQEPDGGFSVRIASGHEPGRRGYMVAQRGTEASAPVHMLSHQTLHDYIDTHHDELSKPGNYFGGWHDPETHIAYLDVSHRYDSEAAARDASVGNQQLAYFSLPRLSSVGVEPGDVTNWEAKHGSLDAQFGAGTRANYLDAITKRKVSAA